MRRLRESARRWLRAVLAAVVTSALVVPLAGAASFEVPAPPPASPPPATSGTLAVVYAANRANAAAASRTAANHGYRHRAAATRALAAPHRQLLAFDGRGAGLVTEVFGDLAHVDRVAVLVPGSDTGLDNYARFRRAARALHLKLRATAPAGSRTAVVAWLGYATPDTISPAVATMGRAEAAAPQLRAVVGDLRRITGRQPQLSLLCHSYGTVVCARAAAGLDVADIAFLGSPGTGADSVSRLKTRARVWAARGAGDWVAHIPHARVSLFGVTVGFGTDPVSPAFGARVFHAGPGGHSAYFAPASQALANLARIVLGRTTEVTDAA
ncbi:alpha/beta hydrolase [Streptomyces fungicidicus]|uniref:Uncharacterized protein n=1 Tax=Streptomyces fungicidicus TaxID=68203 RepID=A0ACC7Y8I0_9ACTN|nr:alpha/beta hydrolase [Streptomyces fungicidicus]NUV78098.1 hypothetical protein [Streptomyces fungicidicus]